MSQFADTRATVRASEAEGDRLLAQLSELVSNPSETSRLESEINANLTQRTALVRDLFDAAYAPGATPTMLHQAQRHSETLNDHKKTTKRLKSTISQERSRRTLLSSVRQDIQTHTERGGGSRSGTPGPMDHADDDQYYGNEMGRINQSHSVVDTILNNAYEARAEMVRQQHTLRDVQRRMLQVAGRVPGLNSLISKINTRQKRNSLILALVVACCVLFIYFVR